MANKRNAKKNIDYAVYTVVHDCLTHLETCEMPQEQSVYEIIGEVISLRNELVQRVNHSPKESAKTYYRNIYQDLEQGTRDAFQKLSNTIQKA